MTEAIQLKDEVVLTPVALTLSNLVVLFHTATAGTVIQSDGHYPIGYHSSDWVMYFNWKLFKGTATLNFG